MIAPEQESKDIVIQWLSREISRTEAKITSKGDYITVQANVKTIEKLLNAEYSVFGMYNLKLTMSIHGF
jgi:tripeptidyl-peptidase-1